MTEPVGAVRWWALVAVVAFVSAVAIWIVSPRFAIDTPSLVDDWSAISKSPDQLRAVARLENPEVERFRPGWIVWNYLQWHTFGTRHGLLAPNAWNVALRIVVLVAGLCLLTALALPPPRDRPEALLGACLAGVPALLAVTVPKFGVDLARFGPQEPLLVGGMALGGALLVMVGRSLLEVERRARMWGLGVLAAFGCVLWVLGVYQKETSLAALPLVASALWAGRARFASWGRLSGWRRVALASLGLVAAIPLMHVALETSRIVVRGDLVYGAEVSGGQGVIDGLGELYDWSHEVLPLAARLVMIAALGLTVLVAVLRRRVDVVAVGALASAALSLVLTAQSGTVATRYYMPAFALCAIALVLGIAGLPRPAPVLALAAIALFEGAAVLAVSLPYVPVPGGRGEVRAWVDREQQDGRLVRSVAGLQASGCTISIAGLGSEAAEAFPVLVRRERNASARDCDDDVYLVVGPGDAGVALASACARGASATVEEDSEVASLEACHELRTGLVRDPDHGRVTAKRLIQLRALGL